MSRIGVFLCECGRRIAPRIDLPRLQELVGGDLLVNHVQVEPFTCLNPGIEAVRQAVEEHKLDRVVVAGCEARIMLKKFEQALEPCGLDQGQIDMVNLRGHVAAVNDLTPEQAAAKAAKLIAASVAGLDALVPSAKEKVVMQGPVMILGGGIATYTAAQELLRRGVETIIAMNTDEYQDELRMLHEHYPGERHYYERIEAIMAEVESSPLIKRISVGELTGLTGRTGNYTVTFAMPDESVPRMYQAGAIIACLDGQMLNQGNDFGHDGRNVICHTEAEEMIWTLGAPVGRVVFWINDYESKQEDFVYLSARSAWSMARYMREHEPRCQATIMYNDRMQIPLSAGERKLGRELGITWVPYDGGLRPTVQAGFLNYLSPQDHTEYEMPWDKLILSPRRSLGMETNRVAKVLGIKHKEGQFLEVKHSKVRPEMVGRDESFLAGSARYPCDLHEALRQGRRAGIKTAEMMEEARQGRLYAPRMVCVVDPKRCIGCGLCNEICDCGGIESPTKLGPSVVRHVDPMVCTGGGTCAAACPYHALTLQNNTTAQREARVAALARSLAPGEVMAFGCAWGGLAAADNAGVKAMASDPRMHLLRVSCIGQLDPSVMARAFLEGAPGLLLLGCPPEDCHHSYGVDHTWSRVTLIRKLLALCGIDRRRIALAHVDLNRPEQYIDSVASFVRLVEQLGPLPSDAESREKLQGLYDTVNNDRVRWVLGASLRRPWEEVYPGDQRHALAYDQDMLNVVREEFTKVRLFSLLQGRTAPMAINDLALALKEDEAFLVPNLRELVSEGIISRVHRDGVAHYAVR
ncbi:MAG: hydrogenase iron-sulfur subunit [Thermodesulfobacteriota bacterium]